jgi:NAD(P)-dependent dehydrogenase (short-subunit alcohol dehydrogenase family)
MDMEGKVVVITGAKGGLGTSVTEAFLAAGATVVGISRSIKQTDFAHKNFTAVQADFSSGAAVSQAANEIAARFGRVDAVVHVLGGFAGGTVAGTDDETWERMLDLNLNSGFFTARAFIPHLRKAGSGRLIVVGSKTADAPHAGLAAYITSKAALVMLVRIVAAENANTGVTANVVMPGTMDTPGNRSVMPNADFSKWVLPSDVANLIVWLAGEQASQVNGAVIPISGRDV